MTFIAIMAVEQDGRVAKFLSFPTRLEAEAHVARFTGRFPDAFVVAEPAGPWSHWLIDAKTVTIDVPPPPPPPPESQEIQALRDLAPLIGPAAIVQIDARFGVKPSGKET